MTESVYIGLAVTSHNEGVLCTAKFDNVVVEGETAMPTAFTYQGRLMENDVAANGLYDLEFTLFDDPEGGTQVGNTIAVHDIDVIDGYFTVAIDMGLGPDPFPFPKPFNGDDRWLEISVRPGDSTGSFTTLNPRQEIMPTPYAIYAETAGSALSGSGGGGDSYWTISGSDIYHLTGNVGIGTSSPSAKLEVNGQVKITGGSPGAGKVLTSDAGGLATWQTPTGGGGPDSDWAVSGNNMYAMPSGNVGIGMTNPEGKLHVLGNFSGSESELIVESASGSMPDIAIKSASGSVRIGESFGQMIFYTKDLPRMEIDHNGNVSVENGNVGIGTTDPACKLDVMGSSPYPMIQADNDGAGPGVRAYSVSSSGVWGESESEYGVYGASITAVGVWGNSKDGDGVHGVSRSGTGVYGTSTSGYAGYFEGKGYFSEEVNIDTSGAAALRVSGDEAIWYDGTEFSWGFGGIWNYFSDAVCIGSPPADPSPHKLVVNGTAYKTQGGGSWATPSDARLKNIHGHYQAGLSEVCELAPVRYSYKQDNDQGLPANDESVGVVAQEVQGVIPEAVEENSDGYLMVNNDPIIWAMLNAIKELKAENDALKQRHEEQISDLTARLERIEAIVAEVYSDFLERVVR
jgi:hypothetical protein